MKNKRLYKEYFRLFIDVNIAMAFTLIISLLVKYFLNYLYMYYNYSTVELIWATWRQLKGGIFGNIILILCFSGIFSLAYFFITYKRNSNLNEIIDQTEEMARGNLDKVINIHAKGDIAHLADNINNISKELKNLIVEERKAQQTKNDLITNVSHDLRTPLTSIMGYLEIIDNDKYRDELQLRYYANIAYEKSKSLNLLINDLFELTKMQNNSVKLNNIEINLVELVGQIVAQFEYQFSCEGMKSRIKFPEEKIVVDADPEKLVRAFENLLSNSIKYGKEGHYVDVEISLGDKAVIIDFTNYGEPIPQIDLPYIFDRLYRVEKSRNSNIGGSGLGLAITKNLIELHKGTIEVYSDNEKTMFKVKLPVVEI